MVCGKYFQVCIHILLDDIRRSCSHLLVYLQGRGTSTHAYTHSLDTEHHVYLNLATLKFYCLPDNYEVIDPSLEDIQYVLKPTYEPEHIKRIDNHTKMARAFDGTVYYPGVVGTLHFH